jgi:hypothetical protein
MKKFVFFFLPFLAILTIATTSPIIAQSIDQRLQNFTSDYAKGYAQPLVDAIGANLNTGLYHSADTESEIDIYCGIKIIGTFITSDMQTFGIASPYNQQASTTATVLGGNGSVIPGAPSGTPQNYLSGASNFSTFKMVPLFVPQASVGNLMGTQLMIRYLPTQNISDVGKVSFWGFGIQHSLSQYISYFPINIAAQVAYQKLTVSDNFDASAFSFGIQASKKILIITIYGGFAYERCKMTLSYDYQNPLPASSSTQSQKYSVDFTGANTFRMTVGASINFLIFRINADYGLGKIPVGSIGVGVGL